jgi:hypothetical protein
MAKEDYIKVYRGISDARPPEADVPGRRRWTGELDTFQPNPVDLGEKMSDRDGDPTDGYDRGVGQHWTPKIETARQFAGIPGFNSGYDVDKSKNKGVILEGYVHKRHVVDRRTKEGRKLVKDKEIWSGNRMESEKTLRQGTPVIVTKMHTVGKQFEHQDPKITGTIEKDYPWRARA